MEDTFFDVKVSVRTVEATDKRYYLNVVMVAREDVKDLGNQWSDPGIYVLLGVPEDGSWSAYVGKAAQLKVRIVQDHKFEWSRALLVRRQTNLLDAAERGWLEGRMHGYLAAHGVGLKNIQTPRDDALEPAKQVVLEDYVGVIQHALVMLGYDPEGSRKVPAQVAQLEPEETEPETTGKVHRKLLDVVQAGTQIESTAPSYPAAATVEATGIRYDDELHTSLSAAAKEVTGTDTADGWSFWGVKSESGDVTRLKDLRDRTQNRGTPAVRDTQRSRSAPTKQDRRRKAGSKTTPKKMTAARIKRLLEKRKKGATYVELGKEFGLTQASVYNLLKENGLVSSR